MPDIKQKPPMDKPKTRSKAKALPREAHAILTRQYKQQQQEKAEHYNRPYRGAVQQVEDMAKDGAGRAGRAAKDRLAAARRKQHSGKRAKKDRQKYVAEKGKQGKLAEGRAAALKDRENAARPKLASPGAKTSRAAAAGRAAKNVKGRAGREMRLQTVKAAQQAARRAAQGAKKLAQMVARAAKALVKTLMLVASALGTLLVPVICVLVIFMIVASPFGIFFSGGDNSPEVRPVASVVMETSEEFNREIEDIKSSYTWDTLNIRYQTDGGSIGINWIHVLSVFAGKTTLFDENAMDVVTIDQTRADLINAVFWDMVQISHVYKTKDIYDDTDTYVIDTEYILTITIHTRGGIRQAEVYGFDAELTDIVQQLIDGEFSDLWSELLGDLAFMDGFGDGTDVIGTGSYIWPSAASNRVTDYYGPRTHPVTNEPDHHNGIDVGTGYGTGILAADSGTVTTATYHWSFGNYIIIDHGGGRRTLYAHCSVLMVSQGQAVTQGQAIALSGDSGVVTNAHLHFETHVNYSPVDPLQYFSGYG